MAIATKLRKWNQISFYKQEAFNRRSHYRKGLIEAFSVLQQKPAGCPSESSMVILWSYYGHTMVIQWSYDSHTMVIQWSFNSQLNAHNQFLQTFMGLGITGFLMLTLMLVIPAAFSLSHQSYLYFVFLLIFMVNLLVESMIETQSGVVYYAFFNAFFLFAMQNINNLELNGTPKKGAAY